MVNSKRRIETDVMKIMMSNYEIELVNDRMNEFFVFFLGPEDSPYHGGSWKIRVELPDNYPYKSPSIGFMNTIYHPNIDEKSGSVCLDVINQKWTPMYELLNIFEIFLPQLLKYPNAADPLNTEAAALLIKDARAFEHKVKDYVKMFAARKSTEADNKENDDEDEMSSIESMSDGEASE